MNNTKKNFIIHWVRELILSAVTLAILLVVYWLFLPALTGWGFLWALLGSLLIPGIISIALTYYDNDNDWSTPHIGGFVGIVAILLALVMIIVGVGGSAMFHSDVYAKSLSVQIADTSEKNIPSFEDVERVSLMDTASAQRLGDRTLGGLTDYVSQYNVSDKYTTIAYNGKVYKIAPLEHASLFSHNKNHTIPGYVMVDTITGEATFVKVEEGIKYSPSAFFAKDLLRHIRTEYRHEKLGTYYNFQIDDNKVPYWVVATYEYKTWMGAKIPNGAIIVNAITGEMQKYSLADLPEWVDQAVDGDMVTELYNRHGEYQNGFWNLSDTGKTQVTADYGYILKDNDIYIYTGVTSVAADESNIGFIMVNSRTGECKYYPIAGAEEYSAMSAAEGVVQNFGYQASFPSLVMYEDTPTYVMVLKDTNGLVKKYAMVNMVNYTVVVVEDTLDACKEAYDVAMKNSNITSSTPIDPESIISEVVIIEEIEFVTVAGETIVYIKSADGKCFKQAFAENEGLILLEVGQNVEVEYSVLLDITPAKIKTN